MIDSTYGHDCTATPSSPWNAPIALSRVKTMAQNPVPSMTPNMSWRSDVTTGSPGKSGGNPSPSTRPRLSNRPSPGVASENAQLRTLGWAANWRASASCIDAMRAILVASAPSRSSPGCSEDGTSIDATSTRLGGLPVEK